MANCGCSFDPTSHSDYCEKHRPREFKGMNRMVSDEEIQDLVERCYAYVNSKEGRAALERRAAASRAFADKLRKMRDVPWDALHRPFTV